MGLHHHRWPDRVPHVGRCRARPMVMKSWGLDANGASRLIRSHEHLDVRQKIRSLMPGSAKQRSARSLQALPARSRLSRSLAMYCEVVEADVQSALAVG